MKEEGKTISASYHLIMALARDKQIPLLILYMKLRFFARNKSGYFNNYQFKHRERYHLLPQLRSLGLVCGNKLLSHRHTSKSYCTNTFGFFSTYFENLPEDVLESKAAFSAHITLLIETYIRKYQDIKEKIGIRQWSSRDKCFVRKQEKKQGADFLAKVASKLSSTKFSGQSISFVSRAMIQNHRGISNSSIANHRKRLKTDEKAMYFNYIKISKSPLLLDPECFSSFKLNIRFCRQRNAWIKYYPTACTSTLILKNSRRFYKEDNIVSVKADISLLSVSLSMVSPLSTNSGIQQPINPSLSAF